MPKKKKKITANSSISKEAQIDLVVAAVEKEFGKGSLMPLDKVKDIKCESISTGSISLDRITGVGGIPKGKITELFGGFSSGKTSLALGVVAEAQKNGEYAAYIDVEHAVNIEYAKRIGIIPTLTRFAQPESGEIALNIVQACIESQAFSIIVVDSVAALVPKAEIDGEIGAAHIGLQARLMSQTLRKLAPLVRANTSSCALLFINQIRSNIGQWGNPITTSGGNALKFGADLRIELNKGKTIVESDIKVGLIARANIVKNKLASPFLKCEFPIIFSEGGVSQIDEILDLAIENGILVKSGAWMKHEKTGKMLGPGRPRARKLMHEDNKMFKMLRQEVLKINET